MKNLLRSILLLILFCAAFIPNAAAQVSGTTYSLLPNTNYPAQSFTATGAPTQAINGISSGVLTAKGTWTNFTFSLQATNDNTTFATLTLQPINGGAPCTVCSANGVYQVQELSAMTQVKYNVTGSSPTGTLTLKLTGNAMANSIQVTPVDADPCQDRTVQKQSAAISGTSPSTVVAIANTSGKTTYVCDFSVITGTGATSVQVKVGTGTTCGTGTANLTGALGITVGQQLFFGWGGTVFGAPQVPVSNDVCVTVAGGTAAYAGYATFVQQ